MNYFLVKHRESRRVFKPYCQQFFANNWGGDMIVITNNTSLYFSQLSENYSINRYLSLFENNYSVPSMSLVWYRMRLRLVTVHREVFYHWLSDNVRSVFVRFWCVVPCICRWSVVHCCQLVNQINCSLMTHQGDDGEAAEEGMKKKMSEIFLNNFNIFSI